MPDHRDRRTWWLALFVVAVGSLIRVPQLSHPLAGDGGFRQTQTAFAIREFAANGVHVMHTPLPVFGSADEVPMEFPLFQAVASQVVHLGASDGAAGRVVALLAFQAAMVLWWVLIRRWRDATLATMSLVLMEFLPFGLKWGAACLIDFSSLAAGLVMVLGFDVWVRSGGRLSWSGLLMCVVGAWAVFLVKVTTVPAAGVLLLLSVVLASTDLGWAAVRKRAVIGLASGPLTALAAVLLWTRHADQIKARAVATAFLTSDHLTYYNLGHSRFSQRWLVIGERVSNDIAGFAFLVLAIGVVLGILAGGARTRVVTLGILASALAPILIFFHLYTTHSYYLIAIYPALATLCAIGVVVLWDVAPRRHPVFALPPLLLVGLLVGTTYASPLSRRDLGDFAHGTAPPAQAEDLRAVAPAGSRVVTVGCDWDPQLLYFAHRTGLMFRDLSRAEVLAIWSENDIHDYRFVVRCDPGTPIADYLPAGVTWRATSRPEIYELLAPSP